MQRSGASRDYTNLVTVSVDDFEVSGTTIGPEPRHWLAGALGFAIDLRARRRGWSSSATTTCPA